MAKAKNSISTSNTVRIAPPRMGYVDVTVGNKGLGSSLIVHAIGQKTENYLRERGQNNIGKRKGAKEKRDPQQEFIDSMYYMPGGGPTAKKPVYAILASGFKKGMMRAAKPIDGIAMTDVLSNIYVCDEEEGKVTMSCKKPTMREDIVRIGNGANKTPDLRYRGEFKEWSAKLKIRYNADFFSGE